MHQNPNSIPPNPSSDQSRVNVFEHITAEEDAFHWIGSTNKHVTVAKSITAKKRATQCLGDISDSTILQISKDRHTELEQNQESPQNEDSFKGEGQVLGTGSENHGLKKEI